MNFAEIQADVKSWEAQLESALPFFQKLAAMAAIVPGFSTEAAAIVAGLQAADSFISSGVVDTTLADVAPIMALFQAPATPAQTSGAPAPSLTASLSPTGAGSGASSTSASGEPAPVRAD